MTISDLKLSVDTIDALVNRAKRGDSDYQALAVASSVALYNQIVAHVDDIEHPDFNNRSKFYGMSKLGEALEVCVKALNTQDDAEQKNLFERAVAHLINVKHNHVNPYA
jgi:hypothetical protein